MAFLSFRDTRLFHGSRANLIYEFLGRRFSKADHWRFMNYGYAFDDPSQDLALQPEDEDERYGAQLYHLVASQADLAGKRLLDVGSGRGGGASYVHRYLGPRQTIGMDFAQSAVTHCRRIYSDVAGLEFTVGDAMDMPFDSCSFDAVMNVESAHCYPVREAFLAEVLRVLKPGGSFLFIDFTTRRDHGLPDIDAAGFEVLGEHDATPGILKALTVDKVRRRREVDRHVPFGLRWLGNLWAGGPGSWIYNDFQDGSRRYVLYHARKPQ